MRTLNTITLKQLLEVVQDAIDEFGEDELAVFTTNYNDHGRTRQALGINGEAIRQPIDESAYSNSGFELLDNSNWPHLDYPDENHPDDDRDDDPEREERADDDRPHQMVVVIL